MEQTQLIGLFLMIIGMSMFLMGAIYKKTRNLNLSWIIFGIIYAIGIFGILHNRTLFSLSESHSQNNIFSPISFGILGIGIMMSYILFGKNERKLILSVLFVVGLHIFPFKSISATIIATVICLNAILGFYFKKVDVSFFIFLDSLIKIISGIILFLI